MKHGRLLLGSVLLRSLADMKGLSLAYCDDLYCGAVCKLTSRMISRAEQVSLMNGRELSLTGITE